jgi:flagellar motor switch protein FliM
MVKKPDHSTRKNSPATSAALWEQIARKLASVFAKKYRIRIDSAEAVLSSLPFGTWAAQEAEGQACQISLFRIEGIRSPSLFLIRQGSGAAICDLLLGGRPGYKGGRADKSDASFATITQRIESRFIKVLAAQLADELADWGAGTFRYFSSETDIRLYNQIGPDIPCLSVRFRFLIEGADPVEVVMVVPQAALNRLDRRTGDAADDTAPAQMLVSYKHLENLEVDLSVALADINMTLRELVELMPGDVLAVTSDRGILRVEGKPYKTGELVADGQDQWIFRIG